MISLAPLPACHSATMCRTNSLYRRIAFIFSFTGSITLVIVISFLLFLQVANLVFLCLDVWRIMKGSLMSDIYICCLAFFLLSCSAWLFRVANIMHAVDARLHELACCEWESVRGGINFIHRVRDHQLQRMYLGSDHHALWLLVLRTRSVWCALCLCFHLCLCLCLCKICELQIGKYFLINKWYSCFVIDCVCVCCFLLLFF